MDATDKPITDRMKEPSTYVGILATLGGVLAVALGKPTLADPTFWAGATAFISGLVNIFTKERKPK